MIITKNLTNDFDDQILTYHKIIDCIVDEKSTDVVFVVGSWVSQENEIEKPLLKTNINVHYDQWSFEYYNIGPETVMGHPDWQGNGPPRPEPACTWNPITLDWVAPKPIPLDELKATKWNEIKVFRSATEFGGFEWNGYIFDSSQLSVVRIGAQSQAAIISKLMVTPYSIDWKLKDNSIVTLSNEEMISVSVALSNHMSFCHNKSTILRTELDAAESSLQISQVIW